MNTTIYCLECEDGQKFSCFDCPKCGPALKAELAKIYGEGEPVNDVCGSCGREYPLDENGYCKYCTAWLYVDNN